MKTFKKAFAAILMPCIFLSSSLTSYSQKSNRPISSGEQKLIIDKVFALLKDNYIFPEVVPAMEKEIVRKFSEKGFEKSTTAEEFIRNINVDLEALSKDRHVNIFYDPVRVKQNNAERNNGTAKPAYAPEFLARAKYENYMLRKAERLDGNVGYLKFNSFVDPDLSKPTIVAAMNFLVNSSALIIDLRQNGGGDARTCSFLLNYFLPDSTLLMHRRSRMTNENTAIYTTKDAAINKFSKDIPVFILTSKRTSSAAEAFAYTLQSYKRATVIGEITNGEANPGYVFSLNSEMYLMIPVFENMNPITKTNWQEKGLMPDLQITADKAFTMAQLKAYEALSQITPVPDLKNMYDWMAVGLQSELQPITLSEIELKTFTGDFTDNRHITFSNGELFYYRGENEKSKKKMFPLKADLFGVDGVPFFRIRFVKNAKGEIEALEGVYDDGIKELSRKI